MNLAKLEQEKRRRQESEPPQLDEARLEKRKRIQDRLEEERQLKETKLKINQDGNKLIKQIQESIKYRYSNIPGFRSRCASRKRTTSLCLSSRSGSRNWRGKGSLVSRSA
jgi:hypothetical protein